jgi:hypothetical protein
VFSHQLLAMEDISCLTVANLLASLCERSIVIGMNESVSLDSITKHDSLVTQHLDQDLHLHLHLPLEQYQVIAYLVLKLTPHVLASKPLSEWSYPILLTVSLAISW